MSRSSWSIQYIVDRRTLLVVIAIHRENKYLSSIVEIPHFAAHPRLCRFVKLPLYNRRQSRKHNFTPSQTQVICTVVRDAPPLPVIL